MQPRTKNKSMKKENEKKLLAVKQELERGY